MEMHRSDMFINSFRVFSFEMVILLFWVFFFFFRTVTLLQCSWVWSRLSLRELLRLSWIKLEGKSFLSSQVSLANRCLLFWCKLPMHYESLTLCILFLIKVLPWRSALQHLGFISTSCQNITAATRQRLSLTCLGCPWPAWQYSSQVFESKLTV